MSTALSDSNAVAPLRQVSLRDLRAVYDPEMHVAMLEDAPRHRFYSACLRNHRAEIEGQPVLDLGAGTGILTALALKYGAAGQVHAVEALPEVCRLIPEVLQAVLDNNERSRVQVHCGFVRDLCNSPSESWPTQVVAIISEWLGVMALNEGMVLQLLHCRDAFLKAPRLVPGVLRVWAQLAHAAPEGASPGRCGPLLVSGDSLLGQPLLLLDADLHTCSKDDLFSKAGATLHVPHIMPDGASVGQSACGLVGWFDLLCCKDHTETLLSTGPDAPATHWVQCWMPLREPVTAPAELQLRLRLAPPGGKDSESFTAGLPELAVEVEVPSADYRGLFLLDSGYCEYCSLQQESRDAKRARTEGPSSSSNAEESSVEVHFFPSDIRALQRLAAAAVADGAG